MDFTTSSPFCEILSFNYVSATQGNLLLSLNQISYWKRLNQNIENENFVWNKTKKDLRSSFKLQDLRDELELIYQRKLKPLEDQSQFNMFFGPPLDSISYFKAIPMVMVSFTCQDEYYRAVATHFWLFGKPRNILQVKFGNL
jgi:hypothetical protein